MRISYASMLVDDQEKALQFYTRILGFQVKHDVSPTGFPSPPSWSTTFGRSTSGSRRWVCASRSNPPTWAR